MEQIIKINVPEGKIAKQTIDKNGNIIITYVDKTSIKSKSWEEFCENHPSINGEYYINSCCYRTMLMQATNNNDYKRSVDMKGLLASEDDLLGIIAFIQLTRLHDEWVGDWEPDWKDDKLKYIVCFVEERPEIRYNVGRHRLLSFPDDTMAKEFLECFHDLIETAKKFI